LPTRQRYCRTGRLHRCRGQDAELPSCIGRRILATADGDTWLIICCLFIARVGIFCSCTVWNP
jgi:hypothetical protein